MTPPEEYVAVDTLRPVDQTEYRYPSARACEQHGPHVVRFDHWPPRPQLHTTEPCEAAQCERCGAHVIVTMQPTKGIKVVREETKKT